MQKITILFSLFFSILTWAEMNPVTKDSNTVIKDYASGVCSIGFKESGTKCCTGFRIADDLIMTNFHCLACVHNIFQALVGETPLLMEPSRFLYSLPKNNPKVMDQAKKYLQSKNIEIDYNTFEIPSNDLEFQKLMNSYPHLFTEINFNNTIDNEAPIEESAYKIKEIMSMNLVLDYSILRVEGMNASQKTFQLSDQTVFEKQNLTIVGHPSTGKNPHKKVFDESRKCKVIDPVYSLPGVREHIFTHLCETAPGSSGSPIIDRESGTVVGLHWGGQPKKDAFNVRKVNYGIEMKQIILDVASKR
jgi:hypothetical protein